MTQDPNKKSLRSFQCRDYLWTLFEQMSAELECSVDYLINESMRQYARGRSYPTRAHSAPSMAAAPAAPAVSSTRTTDTALAVEPSTMPPRAPASSPVLPSMPGVPRAPGVPAGPSRLPPPPRSEPRISLESLPSLAANRPKAPAPFAPPPRPRLTLIFNGQRIPVTKDEFVIGRGSKSADFTIRDGNISRRHAVLVFHEGEYYMKDLGSTNGVEFEGRRIDVKRIEEGDVFHLCEYAISFTYR